MQNKSISNKQAFQQLNLLFEKVKGFRSSKSFREFLHFAIKFKHLAPFNALIVKYQRPGCDYLLNVRDWEKRFNRRIKDNALPVVILVPFGPVDFLFDISDTEPIDDNPKFKTDEELLEYINRQFDTKKEVHQLQLDWLVENLPIVGVAYTDNLKAGSQLNANIVRFFDEKRKINVRVDKDTSVEYFTNHLISVNSNLSISAKFTGILHELGHYFCDHLNDKYSGGLKAKEFEAESAAWLVCERLSLDNPSEVYLANYLDKNDEIPKGVNMDNIFKAHNEIWKLVQGNRLYAPNNFLYKTDPDFRHIVDSIKREKAKK